MTARKKTQLFSIDAETLHLCLILRHFVHGEPGNGESHDRLAADRVDVGQRIGGGNPAEIVWIIDDGHEEVGRRDHALFVVDLVNGRVIARLKSDQQRRIRGVGRQLR